MRKTSVNAKAVFALPGRIVDGPTEDFRQSITEYQYDAQGNLLRDGNAEYRYDGFNRLVKTETFAGEIQINRYDAEGLRHEIEENGKLVQFLYSGTEAVAETEPDGTVLRYIRGNRLICSDSEKARCYYHYVGDELGSITHIVKDAVKRKLAEEKEEKEDRESRVANRYEYDAFGNTVECEETVPNRYRFAGEQYDPVFQQYYLRARFYNPVIGRFLQEDDEYGDGLNLYAYCRNHPVGYVDPSGHGAESAADKANEKNKKALQDMADEISNKSGATPDDVQALRDLAKEFGLNPDELNIKTSQQVNEKALRELANEVNEAGGATPSEQKIFKEFADEYGVDYDSLGVKGANEGGSDSFGKYSTKIDDKVTVIDKQELPSWLGKTFKDGNYRTVVTNEEIIVYRSFGYNAEAGGAFATSNPALNRIQTKMDSAILPEWKNTLRYEAEIVIPKGTTMNIGRVEEQFTMSGARLAGDADQFLLPEKWDLNWIKSIREVRP